MTGNPSSTTTTENSALVTTATKAMNAAIEGIQRKLKRNRYSVAIATSHNTIKKLAGSYTGNLKIGRETSFLKKTSKACKLQQKTSQ